MKSPYKPFDSSKEAITWRRENKARVSLKKNKEQKKPFWLLWVAVGILAMISIPLAFIFTCLILFFRKN